MENIYLIASILFISFVIFVIVQTTIDTYNHNEIKKQMINIEPTNESIHFK